MINFLLLGRYISKDFLIITFNSTLSFFCLGVILNLFEEINFFKDYEVGIFLPIMMSFLKAPNLIYNLFPFIILISSIWLFIKFMRSYELTAIKIAGISNTKIILVPSLIAFIIGIVFVLGLNTVTSALTSKYFNIKNTYSKKNDYLAAITVNGIWIKEKNVDRISIVRSDVLDNEKLLNVSIYQFDQNNTPIMRIEAKSANIKSKDWVLNNAKIYQKDENLEVKTIEEMIYSSSYDFTSISELYSNLETVSFWDLKDLKKVYEERGYSTKEVETEFHRLIAFPFFLLGMVLLAGASMLGINFKGKYVGYIFFAIIACVIIYYFNDFSKVLGETNKLPTALSVWMPILIIFIFSSIGVIHVHQK